MMATSLTRKLDGAPAVLPPISPLIDRRKLSPTAFEPVAESLEKNGFSVGWNDGSLQVGGSLAQSGLCSPSSSSSRSSHRPRTSGFLSFSRARDSRQRTPASSSSTQAPPTPLTPPASCRRQPTPHERFSRLNASLDSATASILAHSCDIPRSSTPPPGPQITHATLAAAAAAAAAANAASGDGDAGDSVPSHSGRQSTPTRAQMQAGAPLPSTAKIASTLGMNVPMENMRDSERPGMGVPSTGRYTGSIIQVPLGVPSPRSHQAQIAAFRASRGQSLIVFNEIDSDKNGKVTRSEFEAAALSLGFSLEQAQRCWERLDRRGRGYLEAVDWGTKDAMQQIQLFSTRYMQKYMGVPDVSSSPEQVRKFNRAQEVMQVKSLPAAVNMARTNAVARGLRSAGSTGNPIYDTFRYMDVDGSGVLSREEVRDAFFALGVYLSDHVIEQIMATFDKNGNGVIQYHEFETTMFPPTRGL